MKREPPDLKKLYDDTLKEPLPDDMKALLAKLK
jgi:hypothetical protein